MRSIFVASASPYAGKNIICLGLAKRFQKEGKKVGFFKPVGAFPTISEGVLTDENALFYKKVLGLKDAGDILCPVVVNQDVMDSAFSGKPVKVSEKVKEAYKKISKDKDVVLIMGIGVLASGSFLGVSEKELIEKLNSKVIFVDNLKENIYETVDSFLYARHFLKDRLLGVVFNRVRPQKADYIKNKIVPFLKKKKVDVLGVINEDPLLGAVTINELKQALDGRIICCPDRVNELVEHFMIGAMNVDAALRFFKRVHNKAVITGGDRSDIQLAALTTSTKCLILTGDMNPEDIIIAKAQQQGVPILVVPTDTLTTVDKFESLLGHLSLRNESKVPMACDVVEKNLDLGLIKKKIGL